MTLPPPSTSDDPSPEPSSHALPTTLPPGSSPSLTEKPHDVIKPTASLPSSVQVPISTVQSFSRNMADASHRGLASIQEPLQKRKEWNTDKLGMRLAGDVTAAAAAGGLVAPLISIIDRAIIENASNKAPLSTSITTSLRTLALQPHKFLTSKPFLLIFALYGGTYLSANTLDTLSSTVKGRAPSSVTSGTSKFAITSGANLSLCLYKDSQFTKMFGAGGAGGAAATVGSAQAQARIPPVTYALFALRDSLTVFASFNVPPLLAPVLPISEEVERYASRASIAQFVAPAAVQAISTPLHLLGLDLYNRPSGQNGSSPGGIVTAGDRMGRVVRDWGKSFLARICRIVPAFGVGGVVNLGVRGAWMRGLEEGVEGS